MTFSYTNYTDSLQFYGTTSPKKLVEQYGSPLYVYNEKVLRHSCKEMAKLVSLPNFSAYYSTKANGNPHLLRIIREQGLMADAMSPGEVALLQQAGFSKDQILYVCNNVSAEELAFAAANSFLVSVDSLEQLNTFGQVNPGSSVMVRLNPGIGAGHHKKVITAGKSTKFGVSEEDFATIHTIAAKHNLRIAGINQHIGSLFLDSEPYLAAVAWLLETAKQFPTVEVIDFGGGFGIPYEKYAGKARLDIKSLGQSLSKILTNWQKETKYTGRFFIEPGRYIAAECGALLGTVHAIKNNDVTRYVGTDVGFNILSRVILYDAHHDIEVYQDEPQKVMEQTITGNICESGDVLAQNRLLPEMRLSDIIGVLDAGAYGQVMSSTYNQRPRTAEILIEESGNSRLIRKRDTVEDILRPYLDG